MTFAQFIHVAQFYETILCFSILVLIGQRLIMMCRDLDQKYLKARAKQFDDQIDWQKSFTKQKQIIAQQQEDERKAQQQQKRRQEERNKIQEERKKLDQQIKNQQPPKQQNLRSSLVQNQHDQTDRRMTQDQQTPQRKSLIQLRKSKQRDSKDFKNQVRQEEIKDIEQKDQEIIKNEQGQRKSSTSIKRDENIQLNIQFEQKVDEMASRNNTVTLEGAQINNQDNNEQPSINPHDEQQDKLQKQYKDSQKIKYFIRIDAIFNEYIPILMSILVLGILSHSTYIFTMVCFFGYMFASLLFNYANLLSKLKNQPTETSIFSKANKLFSGIFILALFGNYWFDDQFS